MKASHWLYKFLARVNIRMVGFFLKKIDASYEDTLEEFWGYVESKLQGKSDVKFAALNSDMVENIYTMQNTIVREVMVPRTDLDCVRVTDSVDKAISLIREKGRSRLPVFEGKVDNMVGMLYAKDVLRETTEKQNKDIDLAKIMRPAYFVPETKNVFDLLHELRLKKVHLAIVIDEYGGTAGLITMEDMIEEIIGEVQDEYDSEVERITKIDENSWRCDAKIPLEEINDYLEIEIPREEEYDTLAGYILYKLGRIPEHKEKVTFDNYQFVVIDSNEKSIDKVKIIRSQHDDSELEG